MSGRSLTSRSYHDHGRCLVRELSPSLRGHKPGINYLLTFATLPHTRLLNIILNHFYLASPMNFRFYQLSYSFLGCIADLLNYLCLVFLIVKRCRLELCRRRYTFFRLIDWLIDDDVVDDERMVGRQTSSAGDQEDWHEGRREVQPRNDRGILYCLVCVWQTTAGVGKWVRSTNLSHRRQCGLICFNPCLSDYWLTCLLLNCTSNYRTCSVVGIALPMSRTMSAVV